MFAIEHKIQENTFQDGCITVTPPPTPNSLLRLLQQTAPERLSGAVRVRLSPGPWPEPSAASEGFLYFPEAGLLGLSVSAADGPVRQGSGVRLALLGHHQVWVPGQALDTPVQAQVLVPGHALRVPQALLHGTDKPLAAWRLQVAASSQKLMTQMARMAACAQHHSASQSLASWLLMARHHCRGDALQMPMRAWRDWLGLPPEVWDSAWQTLQAAGGVALRGQGPAARIQIGSPALLAGQACACHQTLGPA